MRDYVIMVDSDCEISWEFAEENNIPVFEMPYSIDGEEHLFDLGKSFDSKAFYAKIRGGAKASTSTRSLQELTQFFEAEIADKDILYICFSSKLSSHYDLCLSARAELLEKYPDAKFEIVDSKSISAGLAILVYHAVEMKNAGASFEEIQNWCEDNKMRIHHFFVVDSLDYLKKTGRLSAINANIGTMLGIKPVLTIQKDGGIVVFEKVKGAKNVPKYLFELVKKFVDDTPGSKRLAVAFHSDNPEPTTQLLEFMRNENFFDEIWFRDVGPVIGSHCGPGVISVCIMGKEREK